MTEHDAKGLEIIAGWLQRDGLIEPAAMLRRLAAGASEGQAEPIYQIRSTNSGTWHDVDKERYVSTRFERRIVYTHDLNNRVLALEASLYLKDAEIAALRERIAGMEKDAQRYREAGVWEPDGSKFRTYLAENLNGKAMYVKEQK